MAPAARIKTPERLPRVDTAEKVLLASRSILQTHTGSWRAKTAAGSVELLAASGWWQETFFLAFYSLGCE